MNVKYSIVAALFIAALPGTSGAEVWTLDRAVRTALSHSTGAAVDRLDAESALLDAESARMGWYPGLSASAGANYVSDVMELRLPTRSLRFGDNDAYNLKVGFNQLLYDGGRLSAQQSAGRSLAEMNRRQAEAAELATEFQAKSAFYAIAAARENVLAAEQSIREAENHLRETTALREQGMALEDAVLLSRLRVSQAKMDLASRQGELERAKASFRKTTGISPDAEVTVEWRPLELDLPDSDPVETARRLRPEFEAFDAALQAAEYSAASARAGQYPSVGLTGAFNYGRPGLDLPANDWMHWFSGGIALNWNFWDWGRTGREVKKAEITRKITVENLDELRRAVAQQVSDALTGYEETRERNALAQQSLEFAESHLELVKSSFRNGEATERDYDAAHIRYTQALHDAAAASVALQVSRARVEFVLGIRHRGGSDE